MDIRQDARLTDNTELEFGTDTDYDFRMDSATGNLILRNGSTQVVSVDSDENLAIENGYLNLNENNIRNVGAIQDNSQTDSLVFQENNSVVVPNGNLDMQQNDIDEYFDSNCESGDVVQRVYANGSYKCLDIAEGDSAQSLAEVLDVGNKAVDDDINMTDQDIQLVNRLETNVSGNFIDGSKASFAVLDSGSGGEIDIQSDVEMNSNTLESDDGQEFNISDLQAIKDGFEVENGEVEFNNSNGLRFVNSKSNGGASGYEGRIYMNYTSNDLILNARDVDQRLKLTDNGEFIFEEWSNGGNIFEINSQGSNGDGAVEIGNNNGAVPVEMNDNNITELDSISGNSEAIESQNDVNMSNNDVNEAKSINFGDGASGERLVKTGGDLCLGDQC
jgi:hypothetical protein